MPAPDGSQELENNVKAIIAVDLDDVLSSTNEHIAACSCLCLKYHLLAFHKVGMSRA